MRQNATWNEKVRQTDPSIKLTELVGKLKILEKFMRAEHDYANTPCAACISLSRCHVWIYIQLFNGWDGSMACSITGKTHVGNRLIMCLLCITFSIMADRCISVKIRSNVQLILIKLFYS